MSATPRVVLLCAGMIGHRALSRLVRELPGWLSGVFSYRVEAPQDVYLERIRALTSEAGVPFWEASNVGARELESAWDELAPDFVFAAKWRTMVPRRVLERARRGFIIFHAALLPKYRGFAPLPWPIINREAKTGVTMFYAADAVDSGDIIDQHEIPLGPEVDVAMLEEAVADNVAAMLVENLPLLAEGTAPRTPQDQSKATYCIWRDPDDGEIDWSRSCEEIDALVRALTYPYPGAFTTLDGRKLVVWKTRPDRSRPYVGVVPGKVERVVAGSGVNVLAGDGVVQLVEVQLEGEDRRPAWEVITKLKTRLGRR